MSAILVHFSPGEDYGHRKPLVVPGPCFDMRGDERWMEQYVNDAARHGMPRAFRAHTY